MAMQWPFENFGFVVLILKLPTLDIFRSSPVVLFCENSSRGPKSGLILKNSPLSGSLDLGCFNKWFEMLLGSFIWEKIASENTWDIFWDEGSS